MLRKIYYLIFLLCFATVAQASAIDQLLRNKNIPFIGPANAKVSVVEFFDYQCGYCIRIAKPYYKLMSQNPNVKFIFIDFPIRGEESELAARAALAANLQHRYLSYHHALLMTNLALTPQSILDIAQEQHLNLLKLKKAMNSKAISDQLERHSILAQIFGINVTPAFIVAKTNAQSRDDLKIFLGAADMSDLQTAINQA